jgi:hypothetical protein
MNREIEYYVKDTEPGHLKNFLFIAGSKGWMLRQIVILQSTTFNLAGQPKVDVKYQCIMFRYGKELNEVEPEND